MINLKLATMLSDEMNFEFYSAYLYFGLAARLDELRLSGMAQWMRGKSREELDHGMAFYRYISDAGAAAEFKPVPPPAFDDGTPLAIFNSALEHERRVTAQQGTISSFALEVHDFGVIAFLEDYHAEQRSEERQLDELSARLEMAGDDHGALLFVDRELAAQK
ncbi:MAG: ferritin [Victivallaceae bacterium]|nr:ferritin [Victivallaceae bacterium]